MKPAKCSRPTCHGRVYRNSLCRNHARVAPHGYQDAAAVGEHVRRLRCRYDRMKLSEVTGLNVETLRNIAGGRYEHIQHHTYAVIMAVLIPSRPVPGDGLLPTAGTSRRIRGLQAIGWPQHAIGGQLRVFTSEIARNHRAAWVSSLRAAAISEVFEQWQLTVGPSALTAERAKTAGWPVPLAWNEDTIDDPDAKPHTAGHRRTYARFAERYAELIDLGERNEERIATRLGITVGSLADMCYRNGLRRIS